ncbi:hypothetical protein [Brachyspira aalborgi]|uniref:Lipoprotein n=1 Tax=Brachyspira aalborgi TaxID=29522 RepID=A0A5C8G315_9SPIR|nr:hypothetical protein [Brachyspira aalborgi]TXJ55997.1 hypothetical protein EPJ76_05865 [Brachyspira aalborgi]
MKNSKNKKLFTYMVVGALVMALSISCKSNEEPSSGSKAGTNPPAGEYSATTFTSSTPYTYYTNKATVTHNGNGCTISGTLKGYKLISSTNAYKTNNFSITVNSWTENSDGNGSGAQGEQLVLNSPQGGGLVWIKWFNTDSGNTAIDFQLYDVEGFYYHLNNYGSGLTN